MAFQEWELDLRKELWASRQSQDRAEPSGDAGVSRGCRCVCLPLRCWEWGFLRSHRVCGGSLESLPLSLRECGTLNVLSSIPIRPLTILPFISPISHPLPASLSLSKAPRLGVVWKMTLTVTEMYIYLITSRFSVMP